MVTNASVAVKQEHVAVCVYVSDAPVKTSVNVALTASVRTNVAPRAKNKPAHAVSKRIPIV